MNPSILRLNVGFAINQAIGYQREFSFEVPEYDIPGEYNFKNLEGKVLVSRTTEGILIQVQGSAQTEMECVNCLDQFMKFLELDFVEIYTFPTHVVEDTELILPDDFQIDLAPLIREYLHLDIPINPICKSNCKGLCPVCGENLNLCECNHDDEVIDDRMSILKSLLDDPE